MVRYLRHEKASSAYNMALDEALLRLCHTHPVIRIYSWQEPAVSIGYFQSIKVVPPKQSFIRRLTGGGLVDHTRDFTYTLVLPRIHFLAKQGTSESYRLIHESIQLALTNYGIETKLVPIPSQDDSPACFQKPVKFDLIDNQNKKIAGAAQRRTQMAVLHQGSLLLGLSSDHFLPHFLVAMEQLFQTVLTPDQLTLEETALTEKLERERYALTEWNEAR